MNKKNKADFIDEEEFLSAVSMNKKGGCVRMGKPPQETDNTPHETRFHRIRTMFPHLHKEARRRRRQRGLPSRVHKALHLVS